MKCIKDTEGRITRVKDDVANEKVDSGEYTYCGKAEWKKEVRDKK